MGEFDSPDSNISNKRIWDTYIQPSIDKGGGPPGLVRVNPKDLGTAGSKSHLELHGHVIPYTESGRISGVAVVPFGAKSSAMVHELMHVRQLETGRLKLSRDYLEYLTNELEAYAAGRRIKNKPLQMDDVQDAVVATIDAYDVSPKQVARGVVQILSKYGYRFNSFRKDELLKGLEKWLEVRS